MAKFIDFLKNSGYPSREWGLASLIMLFGRRLAIVLDERREILIKSRLGDVGKYHIVRVGHLRDLYHPSTSQNLKFRKITGLTEGWADFHITKIAARERHSAFQVRKRHGEGDHNRCLRESGSQYSKFRDIVARDSPRGLSEFRNQLI